MEHVIRTSKTRTYSHKINERSARCSPQLLASVQVGVSTLCRRIAQHPARLIPKQKGACPTMHVG